MDEVARWEREKRNELFSETAARMGTTPAVVEKDFWVTWVLGRLFEASRFRERLLFKGGTSLSKVYGLIERFSEDIDLILDWRLATNEDPLAARSHTQQGKLNKAIDAEACALIARDLLDDVGRVLEGVCTADVATDDPHVIDIAYPQAYSDRYLRPEVRLEVGPLAAWLPHEPRTIRPYAAEHFPKVFRRPACTVQVIKAERTFWEKATILHHEAHRPEDSKVPPRYSRHYYDLARMTMSPVRSAALNDPDLLVQVVEFKQRFYPRGWARYDLARPGTFRLIPEGRVLAALERDYREMSEMIFGERLSWKTIIAALKSLEDEINDRKR